MKKEIFKICATGDSMLISKFPNSYDFNALFKTINDCDAKITNLESSITNFDCFASTFCGGQWVTTSPSCFDDLLKYGFNLIGCSNNHLMDYSYDGIKSTINELYNRKIAFAGIGNSLAEASRYSSIVVHNKRVAIISVTSTFVDAARAGDSKESFPARPGINPVRVVTKYLINKKHLDSLKEIAFSTFINGERDNARMIGSLPPEENGYFNFGGIFFEENVTEGKLTYCNENDKTRLLREIKKAKKECDYVVLLFHSHQIKHNSYTEPDYFLEEICRTAIDYGADIIFGSGTHQLKPIEIYKKRPIFYSLGNYIFQFHLINKLPWDFWDKYHYNENIRADVALRIKTKNGTIGLETDFKNYISILPIISFRESEIESIDLVPIDLNFANGDLKGLPSIGDYKTCKYVFETLKDISKEYGTKFKKTKNVISVII